MRRVIPTSIDLARTDGVGRGDLRIGGWIETLEDWLEAAVLKLFDSRFGKWRSLKEGHLRDD